ncbi:MAG: hypothetical protein AAFV43_03905 [Planctomycetota bacterium]
MINLLFILMQDAVLTYWQLMLIAWLPWALAVYTKRGVWLAVAVGSCVAWVAVSEYTATIVDRDVIYYFGMLLRFGWCVTIVAITGTVFGLLARRVVPPSQESDAASVSTAGE